MHPEKNEYEQASGKEQHKKEGAINVRQTEAGQIKTGSSWQAEQTIPPDSERRIIDADFCICGLLKHTETWTRSSGPFYSTVSLHLFPDWYLILHPHSLLQVQLSLHFTHVAHHLPVLDGIEGLLVGNVVHEDEAHGSSVVSCGDGAVTLLTCCILDFKSKKITAAVWGTFFRD